MNVRNALPAPLKSALRNLYYSASDRFEVITGRRDPLTPPKRMWHLVTDPSKYAQKSGEATRRYLIEHLQLSPTHRVLDVGCGIGRQAGALATYLDGGSYYGFDIMRDAIEWCQKNITPRYPNFNFLHADIRNQVYNPAGKFAASEYRFPYEDGFFDRVFMSSVFTHMSPPDVENYVAEIARVMKPGARSTISFYLLNAESRANIAKGLGAYDFRFDLGGCYAQDEASPESTIAYDETVVRGMYEKHGLVIDETIYGKWSHTPEQSQDLVIATKV